jgi:SpoVK/Ycf46/Vps4 family AAA+-type ATPase
MELIRSGKSMLVRALANTVGARFLVVSPSCLLRKYVGETNLNVRALFSVASKISPCVIFVDELDGLFRERGGEDHDVSRDLKTEFLQLWDGIRHNHLLGGGISSSSSVLVIGATNRPFDVDPAFLRRMPRRIFIGLPDLDARVAVLTNMLQSVPLDDSFDIQLLARHTSGYSPSDLREVLQAAALYPLREARSEAISSRAESESDGRDTTQIPLSIPPLRKLRTDDVLKALQVAKPTLFSKKYERDLMEYVHRSGGALGVDVDESNAATFTDEITFSSEYFNNREQDSSEDYSYDDFESDDD